jgi:hypothetical protein
LAVVRPVTYSSKTTQKVGSRISSSLRNLPRTRRLPLARATNSQGGRGRPFFRGRRHVRSSSMTSLVDISCSACGAKTRTTFHRLATYRQVVCIGCFETVHIDGAELARGFARIENAFRTVDEVVTELRMPLLDSGEATQAVQRRRESPRRVSSAFLAASKACSGASAARTIRASAHAAFASFE